MRFSIRLELVSFTFCVVLLVGGSIFLYSTYLAKRRILTTFEHDAREITAVISGTIVNDLYFLDLRSLRHRLGTARVNPAITYTYVTDLQGVVLADGTGANALRNQRLTDPFSEEVHRSRGWISKAEGGNLKVGGPIFLSDGSHIGYLQIGFALDRPYEMIRDANTASFTITAISLGIGALLAVILSMTFTRPILSIVQASKEIGEGKLDTRLAVKRNDELGTLAVSINQMAEDLEARRAKAKQAEEGIRRNLDRIRALQEIDQAITSTLDLDAILHVLLEKIDLFLPYASATTVRLMNRETGDLESLACRGLNEEEWRAQENRSLSARAKKIVETEAPLTVRNVQTDPRTYNSEIYRQYGLVSYLGVPLIAKGEAIGVLSFYTKEEHEFTNEEVEFLSTLAGQAAIAIHNSRLYEEMVKLAGDLAKSNRVKDEFLSVMSHELRTPLNVIMGYAGMVRDGMFGELSTEQERALEKVLSRAKDQMTMVTSILQATQLEADRVKAVSEEVHLVDFLDDLKCGYEILLNHKNIVFRWDYPPDLPVIKTDSEKLKHILQNLINNAIKFTDSGSVAISSRKVVGHQGPAVSANPKPLTSDSCFIEFKVSDTGIGIPQEMQPLIFEKFQQVDSSETRLYSGVGLGLYIVKKFTELLGGSIHLESEPGKGSTFTVRIPVID